MPNLNALTTLRKIHAGMIPATQYCKGPPWVIKRRDIERLVDCIKTNSDGSASSDSDQQSLIFQQRSEMGIMTWDRGP